MSCVESVAREGRSPRPVSARNRLRVSEHAFQDVVREIHPQEGRVEGRVAARLGLGHRLALVSAKLLHL